MCLGIGTRGIGTHTYLTLTHRRFPEFQTPGSIPGGMALRGLWHLVTHFNRGGTVQNKVMGRDKPWWPSRNLHRTLMGCCWPLDFFFPPLFFTAFLIEGSGPSSLQSTSTSFNEVWNDTKYFINRPQRNKSPCCSSPKIAWCMRNAKNQLCYPMFWQLLFL